MREYADLVDKQQGPALEERIRWLVEKDFSIHFHVWGAAELLEFVGRLRGLLKFELELFIRNGHETLLVMRKAA